VRRRLPIRVQNACQEDWSAMRPAHGGRGRHCDRCESTVVDLSRATRSQAEAIIRSSGGEVCGRVRSNGRGEAVFAPEPVKTGLVPMAIAGLLAACAPQEIEESSPAAPPEVALVDGSMASGVMLPIRADAPMSAPVPAVAAVVAAEPRVIAVEEEEEEEAEVVPTAEQRAQTRRKHQRHAPVVYSSGPTYGHDMGMMVLPEGF
jgi:hypothetical protein